jgi:hypothetical protein
MRLSVETHMTDGVIYFQRVSHGKNTIAFHHCPAFVSPDHQGDRHQHKFSKMDELLSARLSMGQGLRKLIHKRVAAQLGRWENGVAN